MYLSSFKKAKKYLDSIKQFRVGQFQWTQNVRKNFEGAL